MTVVAVFADHHIEYHVLASEVVAAGGTYDQNTSLDKNGRLMWATAFVYTLSDLNITAIILTDVAGNGLDFGDVFTNIRARCQNNGVGASTIRVAVTLAVKN